MHVASEVHRHVIVIEILTIIASPGGSTQPGTAPPLERVTVRSLPYGTVALRLAR
jgi:hypothetical protein